MPTSRHEVQDKHQCGVVIFLSWSQHHVPIFQTIYDMFYVSQ